MRYVVFALDKPNSLELRKSTREAHLAYLSQFNVAAGGPLLDDDGNMCGSMVVYEADSKADVEAAAAGDPYAQAGLFESVTIREINTVMWPS
ncbi:MAG: YciI family protein [Acidimicrobiales bacterium]